MFETRRLTWFLLVIPLLLISCSSGESPTKPAAQAPAAQPPSVITNWAVTSITSASAECGGTVTSDGGGTVTMRGVCWALAGSPGIVDDKTIDGTGTGSFSSTMTGLTAGTTYYVRAYATNSAGTSYGVVRQFTTSMSTVTDFDGNVYHSIVIGTQVWMIENLKVTHYRNGDAIPNISTNSAWTGLTTGAYGDYDNKPANSTVYGRLYNWYAVGDSRGIAPTGWHVPSDADWLTLVGYFGGTNTAGGNLKEAGYLHWNSPNTGATNASGFTALPGGYRSGIGNYGLMGSSAIFWSSQEGGQDKALYVGLTLNYAGVYRVLDYKYLGYSVRCVRD